MLTVRYTSSGHDTPIHVHAPGHTYRLALDEAEQFAEQLDLALEKAGRPLRPRRWWSIAQYRRAQAVNAGQNCTVDRSTELRSVR